MNPSASHAMAGRCLRRPGCGDAMVCWRGIPRRAAQVPGSSKGGIDELVQLAA